MGRLICRQAARDDAQALAVYQELKPAVDELLKSRDATRDACVELEWEFLRPFIQQQVNEDGDDVVNKLRLNNRAHVNKTIKMLHAVVTNAVTLGQRANALADVLTQVTSR